MKTNKKEVIKNQLAQGDTLLTPHIVYQSTPPDVSGIKPIATKRLTLALGETTGHSHVMHGDVAQYEIGGIMWVCVGDEGAEYRHQLPDGTPTVDHKAIDIKPGWYSFAPQAQWQRAPIQARD